MMWRPEGSPPEHIIAGVSNVLVSPRGDPIPPRELVEALKARHPRFKIEWVKAAWGMSGFVIKEEWKESDPRRDEIRRGARDPESAFDLLTRFPDGCPTGEMLSWIENNLGYVRDPVKEAERRVEEARKALEEAQARQTDQAVETGTRRILDESDHLRQVRAGAERAHPMVPGVDLSEREPKRLL